MKRPIVCGGRDYMARATVFDRLTQLHLQYAFEMILNGGCPTGADDYARQWAQNCELPYLTVPAMWRKLGKSAGPERNQRMIDDYEPDGCIAFPGERGTADMVRRATAANLKVVVIHRTETQPGHSAANPTTTPTQKV